MFTCWWWSVVLSTVTSSFFESTRNFLCPPTYFPVVVMLQVFFFCAGHCYRSLGLIHSAILEAKSLELLMASMAMGYTFLENHLISTAVDCAVGSVRTCKETHRWLLPKSVSEEKPGSTARARFGSDRQEMGSLVRRGGCWSLGLRWSRWLRCDCSGTDNLQAIKHTLPPWFSQSWLCP